MSASLQDPPAWPVLAASVAIFRAGRVLLAARGKEPLRGIYTLPGGRVEAGETLAEAALREVAEETGLQPQLVGFVDHVEIIGRDEAGGVRHHYVIAAFAARWQGGEPQTTAEALDFRWADPVTLDGLPVTDGLHAIVAKAAILAK